MDDKRLPLVAAANGNFDIAPTMVTRAALTLWYIYSHNLNNFLSIEFIWCVYTVSNLHYTPIGPFELVCYLMATRFYIRCQYYLEGGWGWVVLGASVVSTMLTFGCQWTIVDYLSRTPAVVCNSSAVQKGKLAPFLLLSQTSCQGSNGS